MPEITLRPSTIDDKEFVDELTRKVMQDYVEQTWNSDRKREEYYHLNRFSLRSTQIIQINGIDVGRVTISRRDDRIIIDDIHVIPEYQSKGIGSHVMRAALSEAEKAGVLVELKVLKVNPAHKLYERLGFHIVCEDQQRYYMKRGK
ncbi:MAG: GNAT family N-acetyltransferase [Thermodesulfobacteriota bacterium]|nr:GNAT family N-acetyltransferase [Thermodesulfobacteriota bacterium]